MNQKEISSIIRTFKKGVEKRNRLLIVVVFYQEQKPKQQLQSQLSAALGLHFYGTVVAF